MLARATAAPDDSSLQAAIADVRAALGHPLADELGRLPAEAEVAGARFVHASPVSDVRAFAPEPNDEEEELLAGTTAVGVVFALAVVVVVLVEAAAGELVVVEVALVGEEALARDQLEVVLATLLVDEPHPLALAQGAAVHAGPGLGGYVW